MSSTDCDVDQKKNDADLVSWREYEALRDTLRREFNKMGDGISEEIQTVHTKFDATTATVNTVQTQVTDIQEALHALTQSVAGLRDLVQQQQQPQHEDEDNVHGDFEATPAAHGRGGWRGIGHGLRGRGFVPVGAQRVPLQPQEDGLGKPKFSIPRFEGGTVVEEYLTWGLKIEKLWRLHDYTEDRKIKLASSEFYGYALRWWDSLVRRREEDGELPIITWHTMKEAMRARFVPTNYLRSVFDKLTQLRQGALTVDAYYMEMEMLMQRARVRESVEMTIDKGIPADPPRVLLDLSQREPG